MIPTHPYKGQQRKILPGDIFLVTDTASVQFAGDRGIRFRVTFADPRDTTQGWVWLSGIVVDDVGEPLSFRRIFVQKAGLLLFSAAGEA